VLLDLIDDLPKEAHAGLRLFGHMGFAQKGPRAGGYIQNDPRLNTDTELVVGIGQFEGERRAQIRSQIASAAPRGKTPLVYALLQAKRDFAQTADAARLVILVSDGRENCGGKLEDVAKAFRDNGIDYTIHVVGFDIDDSIARHKLQRIAQYGGGNYHDADSAGELSRVLRSAVQNTGYIITAPEGEEPVARGVINGAAVEVKPGRYAIRVKGSENAATPLVLKNDERVVLEIDGDGKISRKASPEN
jgi:Ca-activated chloride channel family protein